MALRQSAKGGSIVSDERERLLTVAEVAERLRVNPETVRRWLRSGELSGIPLGPKAGYRVSEAELEAFIDERRKSAV